MKRSRGPKQLAQVEFLKEILAAGWVRDWSTAIDGGANLGDWTEVLARRFGRVLAFEPAQENYDGLVERFGSVKNVEIHHKAIYRKAETMRTELPARRTACTSYQTFVDEHGDTEAVSIDSMDLPSCGLIKLDLEGNEHNALIGARKTIKRFKPLLIVELTLRCKGFSSSPRAIRRWLQDKGYREIAFRDVDAVFKVC